MWVNLICIKYQISKDIRSKNVFIVVQNVVYSFRDTVIINFEYWCFAFLILFSLLAGHHQN